MTDLPHSTKARRVSSIVVREWGDGIPLILIHGGTGSWTHWQRIISLLADRFHVMAIDLPGYGAAPTPADVDPASYLRLVVDSIADLALGLFDIVGFSFGAVVTAGIAKSLSESVRRISLLGPGGFGKPDGRNVSLMKLPSRDDDPESYRSVVAYNLGQFMLAKAPSPNDRVVDLQIDNINNARFDSRRLSHQPSLISDLTGSHQLLQIIWGSEDCLANPSIQARAELCRSARPDAKIHIVPGAGHWVQHDAPQAVSHLLTQFHGRP